MVIGAVPHKGQTVCQTDGIRKEPKTLTQTRSATNPSHAKTKGGKFKQTLGHTDDSKIIQHKIGKLKRTVNAV